MDKSPNLNILEPNKDEWNKLYQATIEFKKLKPWEWIYDNELYAIKDPQTGEYAYCSIMGGNGEFSGLVAYIGSEGLDGAIRILSGQTQPDDPEFMFIQKSLVASFEDREFLEKEDRMIIKELGLKFRGRNEWPVFRSNSPGYFPWFITSDECRFLTIILQQSIYVALKARNEGTKFLDKNMFKNPENESKKDEDRNKLMFFTRVPERKNGGIKWNDDYISPIRFFQEHVTFKILDELKIKRLQKLGKRKGAAWEIDTFYSPGPVQEERNLRPYYPKVCLVFDQGRSTVLGFNLIKNIYEEGGKFLDLITELIEKHKQLPFKIIVQREETFYLLQDLCKQLGVPIEKVDYLTNLDEARFEMHNFFETMTDSDGDSDS